MSDRTLHPACVWLRNGDVIYYVALCCWGVVLVPVHALNIRRSTMAVCFNSSLSVVRRKTTGWFLMVYDVLSYRLFLMSSDYVIVDLDPLICLGAEYPCGVSSYLFVALFG